MGDDIPCIPLARRSLLTARRPWLPFYPHATTVINDENLRSRVGGGSRKIKDATREQLDVNARLSGGKSK